MQCLVDIGNPGCSGTFPVFTSQFTLALHADLKTSLINGEAFSPDNILSQVHREAKGVVQTEQGLTRDNGLAAGTQ